MIGLIRVAAKLGAVAIMASAGVAQVSEHKSDPNRAEATQALATLHNISEDWLVSIALNDRNHAFIVSRDGAIMKTADGGTSWSRIEPF